MENFNFYNPTEIIFGKDTIKNLRREIPKNSKILIAYGGGSIKRNGVYDQVIDSLKGYSCFEFSGVEANPTLETITKAIKIVKEKKITFILAVGGGSVIDGCKFLAAASQYKGSDPWDLVIGKAKIEDALPFGTILTLPATGSEMNSGGVLTNKATGAKLAFFSKILFPKFSILDPTTTYSLPKKQVANGIIDSFVHTTEQYLTFPVNAPIQDRFSESILSTLLEIGPQTLENPTDYESRASLMWSATLALNGLIGCGVPQDWATHMIGHEITSCFGLDHAQTLAIVLPSLLEEFKEQKSEKLLQYGKRIFKITDGSDAEIATESIKKTREFFESLGVKTYLSDYNIKREDLIKVKQNLEAHGFIKLGEKQNITPEMSLKILMNSYES